MIAIREATPGDAASLAALRWEFRAPRGTLAETEDAFVHRCTEWMRSELASGNWRVWVAGESAIVGQLWMRIIQKLPNPTVERERHAYISNLYVKPAARGGVGGRLLDAALAWARENEVDQIVLWPTERSRSLYRSRGFRTTEALLALTCE